MYKRQPLGIFITRSKKVSSVVIGIANVMQSIPLSLIHIFVQVVINLVNNAIKYTPAGSHISLSAVRAGPFVQVEVSDDGPGIADSAKQKIFDMFYTADNSRGDGRRGLGLGLSLCRSIITAHGGEISVQDHQPHGSVFRLSLIHI